MQLAFCTHRISMSYFRTKSYSVRFRCSAIAKIRRVTSGSRVVRPNDRSLIHLMSGCPKYACGTSMLTPGSVSSLPPYQ